MILIEKAFFTKLSSLVEGRVHPARAPDNETDDFIVFQKTDSNNWRDLDAPTGMKTAYMQVSCYSQEYYKSKSIANDVENILDGFRGDVVYLDEGVQETVKIRSSSLQNDNDDIDKTDEPFLYKVTQTYFVIYE